MPMFTYYNTHENINVEDEDILKAVRELNEATDGEWIVSGYTRRRWFRPDVKAYSLMHRTAPNGVEYEIMPFYCKGNSINTLADRESVIDFIEGFLIALIYYKKKYGD